MTAAVSLRRILKAQTTSLAPTVPTGLACTQEKTTCRFADDDR